MAFFGFRKDKKAAQGKFASDAKAKRADTQRKTLAVKVDDVQNERTDTRVTNKKKSSPAAERGTDFSILLRPRITEKATSLSGSSSVYTFEVHVDATKKQVIRAVTDIYHVTPTGVRMVPVPSKKVAARRARNVYGRTARRKKAYVFLKKGDAIEFV